MRSRAVQMSPTQFPEGYRMVVENMVTATALALPPHTKKVLAPAMNTKMFENPLTQHNLERLQRFGWKIIQPREAVLACGDQGTGALAHLILGL